MTTIIPADLPADVKTWTTEHVKQFIEANKHQYQLRDDHLHLFEVEEITGTTLLKLEANQLRGLGMRLGPADRIADLVNALKKDKGLVETALLSESAFAKLQPPELIYRARDEKKSTGVTRSVHAHQPQSVRVWEDFKDRVNGIKWDNTPKYDHPQFLTITDVANEEKVRAGFYFNVLEPLNKVLDGHERFNNIPSEPIAGEPDFVQTDSNDVVRLVIEVKCRWVLSLDVFRYNLVDAYQVDRDTRLAKITDQNLRLHVFPSLNQVYGYLFENNLLYGALTTYDHTWLLHRKGDNLYVSPAIRYDSQEPTLFQSFLYLTRMARIEHVAVPPPAQPIPPRTQPPGDDDDGDNDDYDDPKDKTFKGRGLKRKSSAIRTSPRKTRGPKTTSTTLNRQGVDPPLEYLDRSEYEILEPLGHGRTGNVFVALLRGELVAFKLCDLWQHPKLKEELLNEIKVYHALEDLQGCCIPKLKASGYTAGGLFVIATEIVGMPLENVASLSDSERLLIRSAISSIHCHGYLHGDIRNENILVQRNGDKFHASIIDFAFSKKASLYDLQKEMEVLERFLGFRSL